MFKYLLSTLVLVFALSTAMAQDSGSTPSKKETTTISKDADVSSQTAPTSTKEHKCAPGCKKDCCSKAEAKKACKPGCEKKCTGKHAAKAEGKHACAPGCTKACCAPKDKK